MMNLFAFFLISAKYVCCADIPTNVENKTCISCDDDNWDSNSSISSTDQYEFNQQLSAVELPNYDQMNEIYNSFMKLIGKTRSFTKFLRCELLFNLTCFYKKSKSEIEIINNIFKKIEEYKPQVIKISNLVIMKKFLYFRSNISAYLFDRKNDEILYYLIDMIKDEKVHDELTELIKTKLNELTYAVIYSSDLKKEKEIYVSNLMKNLINKFDNVITNFDNSYKDGIDSTSFICDIKNFIGAYFELKYEIISLLNTRSYIIRHDVRNSTKGHTNIKFSNLLKLSIVYIYSIIGDDDILKELISLALEMELIKEDKFLYLHKSYLLPLTNIYNNCRVQKIPDYQTLSNVINQIMECHGALTRFLKVEKYNISSKNFNKNLKTCLKEHYKQLKDIKDLLSSGI